MRVMREPTLPRLLLIADRFTDAHRVDRCLLLARAGVPWMQLRDHEASEVEFEDAAGDLVDRLRELEEPPLISINGRADLAAKLGTGCHLPAWQAGRMDAPLQGAEDALLGVSSHDEKEIEAARSIGADYVTFSPVFSTASKPEAEGVGTEVLEQAVRRAGSVPVLALGGITPERVGPCLDAGARGVAVLSGLMDADDPAATVRAYLDALSRAVTT